MFEKEDGQSPARMEALDGATSPSHARAGGADLGRESKDAQEVFAGAGPDLRPVEGHYRKTHTEESKEDESD